MSRSDNEKDVEVFLRERQTLRLGWLRVPLMVLSAFLIALPLFILYEQLFSDPSPADGPLSDAGVVAILIVMLAVGIGLPILIFRIELLVTVDSKALRISLAPFTRRTIPVESIIYCEPRTIQPIRDYIGLGILLLFRGGGVGYAVSGNEGVQIELDTGKRLFLGSQYSEELAAAVAVARSL